MQFISINTPRRRLQGGQTTLFVLLGLGIFLVGGVAFAVDLADLWFHRQTAQNAADAACMAGATDLLAGSLGGATGHQGFVAGTSFDCSTTPSAVPCVYAAFNGYNGLDSSPGNDVSVSFPMTDPNVSSSSMPSASVVPHPLIRVDVLDYVQTFFSGLLSGSKTQNVRAFAVCGVLLIQSPRLSSFLIHRARRSVSRELRTSPFTAAHREAFR